MSLIVSEDLMKVSDLQRKLVEILVKYGDMGVAVATATEETIGLSLIPCEAWVGNDYYLSIEGSGQSNPLTS